MKKQRLQSNVEIDINNKSSIKLFHDFEYWNPDFNLQEFSSNFVARWEYKTESTIYFVWTNYRSSYEEGFHPSIFNSLKVISKVQAQNAFMIKLSYWFSL